MSFSFVPFSIVLIWIAFTHKMLFNSLFNSTICVFLDKVAVLPQASIQVIVKWDWRICVKWRSKYLLFNDYTLACYCRLFVCKIKTNTERGWIKNKRRRELWWHDVNLIGTMMIMYRNHWTESFLKGSLLVRDGLLPR